MSVREDDDKERINLLRAAVADLALTESVMRHLLSGAGLRDATSISMLGGHGSALWSALGRSVIVSSFNVCERLVASFARDEAVLLVDVLRKDSDEAVGSLLTSELSRGLAQGARYDAWGERFARAMADAGLDVTQELPARLASLKVLRNECSHVSRTSRDKAPFLENAGLGTDVTRLTLPETLATLRTVHDLLASLCRSWKPEMWSAERTDIVSDIGVLLCGLITLLEQDEVKLKEEAWRL